MTAITRANDPFWNMRAFDDALALHDGYMLPSFICAMNALVMDDVTQQPAPPVAVPALPADAASAAFKPPGPAPIASPVADQR
jgi:hypothetical protein